MASSASVFSHGSSTGTLRKVFEPADAEQRARNGTVRDNDEYNKSVVSHGGVPVNAGFVSPWGTQLNSMFGGPHPLLDRSSDIESRLKKELNEAREEITILRAKLRKNERRIRSLEEGAPPTEYFREVRKSGKRTKHRTGGFTVRLSNC